MSARRFQRAATTIAGRQRRTSSSRWCLGTAEIVDVTDAGELQQRSEDHEEARHQVEINTLEVGDLGQRGVRAGEDGGHGEYGGDAEADASR